VWLRRNFSTPNPPIRNKSCVQLSAPVARRNMTGDYDDPDLGGSGDGQRSGPGPTLTNLRTGSDLIRNPTSTISHCYLRQETHSLSTTLLIPDRVRRGVKLSSSSLGSCLAARIPGEVLPA